MADKRLTLRFVTLVLTSLLVACSSAPRVPTVFSPSANHVAGLASSSFVPLTLPWTSHGYWRSTASQVAPPSEPWWINVYIEGDGAAWSQRQVAPQDPTPHNPLAASLASHDPNLWVVYLGRPCQYLDQTDLARCPKAWWADARYGDAVLAIMHEALTQAVAQLQQHRVKHSLAESSARPVVRLRLIGYSGGGVIAALLAQQRDDVACLITVAAPLDLRAWTKLQGLSPLHQSQNPATTVMRHANLVQTHWYGKEDRVVPPQALGDYGWQRPGFAAKEVRVLSGYDHRHPWAENWPKLLGQSCQDHGQKQ